jgi:hypothetical protein
MEKSTAGPPFLLKYALDSFNNFRNTRKNNSLAETERYSGKKRLRTQKG